MQYIIGLNGPPRSGKDTVASALRHLIDVEGCFVPTFIDHLARPMRQMAMSLVGLNPSDFSLYNAMKDSPQSLLRRALTGNQDSIRQLMIATSEEFIKPTYGHDFWARKLIQEHRWIANKYPGLLIVPDIGFQDEVDYFDSTLPTATIQLARPGIDWANDSRSYCEGPNSVFIHNDETPEYAARQILHYVRYSLKWNLDCGD